MTAAIQAAWAKVEPRLTKTDAGCWLWTGERSKKGYGRVKVAGVRYQTHRLAAAAGSGLDYANKAEFACHTCDVPSCCNPAHLVTRDNSWNIRDAITKGRFTPRNPGGRRRSERCKRGHLLAETRREYSGGTYCVECSRIRGRLRRGA